MGLLRFGIKSSIAGGIIYYTIQEGLWSTPEDSAKLYNKLYKNVSPIVQKNVPQEIVNEIHQIPNFSELKSYVGKYWNQGVMISIKFISNLPSHIANGIDRVKQEIEKGSLASNAITTQEESKKANS